MDQATTAAARAAISGVSRVLFTMGSGSVENSDKNKEDKPSHHSILSIERNSIGGSLSANAKYSALITS